MTQENDTHPNNMTCSNCINFNKCRLQINRNPNNTDCTYEPSRFSTQQKKEDILDKAINEIINYKDPLRSY